MWVEHWRNSKLEKFLAILHSSTDETPQWEPPYWSKVCPYPLCPSYRQFARLLSIILIGKLSKSILSFYYHHNRDDKTTIDDWSFNISSHFFYALHRCFDLGGSLLDHRRHGSARRSIVQVWADKISRFLKIQTEKMSSFSRTPFFSFVVWWRWRSQRISVDGSSVWLLCRGWLGCWRLEYWCKILDWWTLMEHLKPSPLSLGKLHLSSFWPELDWSELSRVKVKEN